MTDKAPGKDAVSLNSPAMRTLLLPPDPENPNLVRRLGKQLKPAARESHVRSE